MKTKLSCRVAQNLPHDSRRIKAPKQGHDTKIVSPEQRVKEFPRECLTVSGKNCLAQHADKKLQYNHHMALTPFHNLYVHVQKHFCSVFSAYESTQSHIDGRGS